MRSEAPLGPAWADLVFHVLAHVPAPRRIASSLWNPRYVGFCEAHLGPASARPLGEDVAVLSQLLTSHEFTAQLQWAAFLFSDAAQARSVADRDLGELLATKVANPVAVRALAADPAVRNAAELVRATAELEAAAHARLPPLQVTKDVVRLLADLATAAPYLRRVPVQHLRALTRHGRAFTDAIRVGVPAEELDVSAEWVAVQAAHEATVLEVGNAARRKGAELGERDVEHAALVVFASRAAEAPLRDSHARWWAGTELPPLAELQASLGEARHRVVTDVLGPGSP